MRANSDPIISLGLPSPADAAPPLPAKEPAVAERPDDAALDAASLLVGWDYEPGQVKVRRIRGADGRLKLQLRLDLGFLQMEIDGRPDGRRPHDFESLLDYHVDRLHAHRTRHGTELGFTLSADECRGLRDEASMYYHRYLSLFVLSEFEAVQRDALRNLRVLDFCRRHAAEERDRTAMEPSRPYVLMMHARAAASAFLENGDFRGALRVVQRARRAVRRHFRRFGGTAAYQMSGEANVLRVLARHLRTQVPQSPRRKLSRELKRAVAREDYERAAVLRDRIALL